jgi:vacuolar protein sorting-associated protein 35
MSQEDLLKKARADVRTNALQMKKQLDNGQVLESVKFASAMLNELCTSNLSPKSYYDLCKTRYSEREIERDLIIYFYIIDMNITDELRQLEMFMVDEFQKGFKCDDLYELVQYSSAIIPRL